MFSSTCRPWCLLLVLSLIRGAFSPNVARAESATVVVATKDSSDLAKAAARFVGDGEGDQDEINAAIKALPTAGGTALLMEGTYDIRAIEGTLGGVRIERSDVVLAGQGPGTRLILAAGQNTNVIRIIGSGVGNIIIRDLSIDANREHNADGKGDPNVSHDRFEFCGIKAFCGRPGESCAEPCHDITVRNCVVKDAHRLGVMLEGPNMRVVDNVLGNAGSDSVEILTGPGTVRGNYVEITGQTHVAIGSDRANSILMTDNIVHVKRGGQLDIGFRSWANSLRHVIANNILIVDPGGSCGKAVDARGEGAVISGNTFEGPSGNSKLLLSVTGGDTIVSGNVLVNVDIEVGAPAGTGKSVQLKDNLLRNGRIRHTSGDLELDTQSAPLLKD